MCALGPWPTKMFVHPWLRCSDYVFYEFQLIVFCVAVMFAYEQCLLVLGHHPDVWYEAAQYLEQSSKLLAEKGVREDTFQILNLM